MLPAEQASVSIMDRSYLYGEGLFETLRCYDGQIPFLQNHLKRLEWASVFMNLDYPSDVDFAAIFLELSQKNQLPNARLKIVLSRRQTGIEKGEPTFERNLVLFCEPLFSRPMPQAYKLKTMKMFANDSQPIVAMKTTNYLVKILAQMAARDAGGDDGILLNAKGNVTETTSGNIFWIDPAGKLYTVMMGEGFLGGTTRELVIAALAEKNLKCHEAAVTPQELSHMREVFVTNAIMGIKPVIEVDGRQISGREIGPVTQLVSEIWQKKLESLLKEDA